MNRTTISLLSLRRKHPTTGPCPCGNPKLFAKGLCEKCYQRQYRTTHPKRKVPFPAF